MISRTAEYAIRALVALKQLPDGALAGVGALSRITGAPANYLSKIMHMMGRAGVVASVRGPGGGFRLARPAQRVTAFEIVRLFDDLEAERRCFLGNKVCSDACACAAHQMWSEVWEHYVQFLRSMTLERLSPPVAQARRRARTKR